MSPRLIAFAAVLVMVQICRAQEFTLPTGDEFELLLMK